MVKLAYLGGPIAKCKSTRDDRAGRRSSDEIKPIAEQGRPAFNFLDERLQPLQKPDRDCPSNPSAVERKHPLGARPEKMSVARRQTSDLRRGHWENGYTIEKDGYNVS